MLEVSQRTTELFWDKVTKTNLCWVWTGSLTAQGYGLYTVGWGRNKKTYRAHRMAYELCVQDIPDGLELDHLCRVHNCVNPKHLEAVTHRVNCQRGSRSQNKKTHCGKNHEFTEVNTKFSKGKRACRACARDRYYRNKTR